MKEPLNAGDILIFQADDQWISKLIAWGTFSDVSHASMIYRDGLMVEMGLDGIMACNIQTDGGKQPETAYQMRLMPTPDSGPLLAAADRYLDAKIRYDVPALVLLGVALIYRHLHPSTRVYHLLEKLLTLACVALDKLINKLRGHPDAMVCSQLVYQVYQDCGGAYQIDIGGGVLQSAAQGGGAIRLIDFMEPTENGVSAALQDDISLEQDDRVDAGVEPLCRELYSALLEAEGEQALAAAPPPSLTGRTNGLYARMTRLSEMTGIPLDALRVMPADLAYHAENLTRISQITVERLDRVR